MLLVGNTAQQKEKSTRRMCVWYRLSLCSVVTAPRGREPSTQLNSPSAAERPIVRGRAVELALHLLSPRGCGAAEGPAGLPSCTFDIVITT